MFLGRKDEPGTICIAHAVDIDFAHRIVIRADKGPVEYVIRAICEMLQEIGRTRIIISTDGEPSVRALSTWSSMTWCTVAGPYSVGRTPDGGIRTSLSRSMRCHGCRSRHG